jgi:hypothetical protein
VSGELDVREMEDVSIPHRILLESEANCVRDRVDEPEKVPPSKVPQGEDIVGSHCI